MFCFFAGKIAEAHLFFKKNTFAVTVYIICERAIKKASNLQEQKNSAATAEKSTVAAFEKEGHIFAVIPKCLSYRHTENVVLIPKGRS